MEQTINLSSKCSDGVISHAKQKQYITQWDIIYHEMMSVKNVHRQYAGVFERTSEATTTNHLNPPQTERKDTYKP